MALNKVPDAVVVQHVTMLKADATEALVGSLEVWTPDESALEGQLASGPAPMKLRAVQRTYHGNVVTPEIAWANRQTLDKLEKTTNELHLLRPQSEWTTAAGRQGMDYQRKINLLQEDYHRW